jgi:hypothetical protein
MPDANLELMTRIRDKWGSSIADACKSSSVPEAFVAALVANETGGDPDAKRFERGVLGDLWEVLQGRKAAYGSIGRVDLLAYVTAASSIAGPVSVTGLSGIVSGALQRLDSLASSWGLTQVMGYEAIVFSITTSDLQVPSYGLRTSLRMLGQFASRFQLDLGADFAEMFDCWNSGRAHGRTADPNYIDNGLARLQIYQGLMPPKAITA